MIGCVFKHCLTSLNDEKNFQNWANLTASGEALKESESRQTWNKPKTRTSTCWNGDRTNFQIALTDEIVPNWGNFMNVSDPIGVRPELEWRAIQAAAAPCWAKSFSDWMPFPIFPQNKTPQTKPWLLDLLNLGISEVFNKLGLLNYKPPTTKISGISG